MAAAVRHEKDKAAGAAALLDGVPVSRQYLCYTVHHGHDMAHSAGGLEVRREPDGRRAVYYRYVCTRCGASRWQWESFIK